MDLQLNQIVYHKDIYNGNESMRIIGLRENEVELEGDYSGGTQCITQSCWYSKNGVIPIILDGQILTIGLQRKNRLIESLADWINEHRSSEDFREFFTDESLKEAREIIEKYEKR